MANKVGRPAKSVYEDLAQDWKDGVNSMTREAVEHEMSVVSYNQVENLKMKSEDQDLETAKQIAKQAGAQYAEASKANKLKLQYLAESLDNAGGPTKS